MRKALFLVTWCTAALTSAGARAQNQPALDFGQIPGLNAQPTVQIDLGAAMLAFVSAAARVSDPRAADAIAGIEGLRVYVYDSVDNAPAVVDFIETASGRLENDGWERTVFVQDGGDKVRVYAKVDDSRINGLTVMVHSESGEAVFLNVAGSIDPAQLAALMSAVNLGDVFGNLPDLGGATVPPDSATVPPDSATVPPDSAAVPPDSPPAPPGSLAPAAPPAQPAPSAQSAPPAQATSPAPVTPPAPPASPAPAVPPATTAPAAPGDF